MPNCYDCIYGDLPGYEEPCDDCIQYSKFEPEEKENKEMKNMEEAHSCDECLHKDVFVFDEPCVSCLCKVSHPNFVKKENTEMKNADDKSEPKEETKKPKSYCTNCKHIDVGATEQPCLSCWGFNKFEPKEDKVNHPSHYTTGEIEVINYIRDKLGCQEFTGYCIGNVMKYISRWRHKDGAQDLEKAKVYLQWAIESAHKEESEV